MKKIFSVFALALVLCAGMFVLSSCSCKHKYSEWTVERAATCDVAGEEIRTCSRCKGTETREIPALGHEYGALISGQPATCAEDGEVPHYNCSRCGKIFDEQKNEISTTVDPKGHRMVLVENPATCTEDGELTHDHCERCGKDFIGGIEVPSESLVVKALDHDLKEVRRTEATCTQDGVISHVRCERCEAVFIHGEEKTKADVTLPAGHSLVAVPGYDRTCTEDGRYDSEHCNLCGKNFVNGKETESLVIPAGHNLETVGSPKTCTTDGVLEHQHCTVCGKNFIGDTEKKESELVIPKSHNCDLVAESSGNRTYLHCKDCGKNFTEDYVEISNLKLPLEHHFGTWNKQINARCEQDGRKGYFTCSDADCAGKYFDIDYREITDGLTIPATGHHYTKLLYNNSEHYYGCTDCNRIVDRSSHTWEYIYVKEGKEYYAYKVCSVCKARNPNYRHAESEIFDLWVERDFVLGKDTESTYKISYSYTNGTGGGSMSQYFTRESRIEFQEFIAKIDNGEISLPATREFVFQKNMCVKKIAITFVAEEVTTSFQYRVYQKGNISSLTDLSILVRSNFPDANLIYRLTAEDIVSDGGFDPDYVFAEGETEKVYTITYRYNGKEYTDRIIFRNEKTIQEITPERTYVFQGGLISWKIRYSDGSVEYKTFSFVRIVKGSFDPTVIGEQTFTFRSPDGFYESEVTIEVLDAKKIDRINASWGVYTPVGSKGVTIEVQYYDGSIGFITVTKEMVTEGTLNLDEVGTYYIEFYIQGEACEITVHVYDPNSKVPRSVYFVGNTTITWTSKDGLPVVDLKNLFMHVTMWDGSDFYVPITEEMISFDMEKAKSIIAAGSTDALKVTVNYSGVSFTFNVTFEQQEDSEISIVRLKYTYSNSSTIYLDSEDLDGYYIRIKNGKGYRYVKLTADMLYNEAGDALFDLKTAKAGVYPIRIKYGNLEISGELRYGDIQIKLEYSNSTPSVIYGSREYVLEQLAGEKFSYSVWFYQNYSGNTITMDYVYFKDLTLGDISEIDFSTPGEVYIPVSYKGRSMNYLVWLIPDLNLYTCKIYSFQAKGYNSTSTAILYANGWCYSYGSYNQYEWVDRAENLIRIGGYDLFRLNEEENSLTQFTAEMLGGEPTIYYDGVYEIKVYTKDGVSYADKYRRYSSWLSATMTVTYEDGFLVLNGELRYTIGEGNKLTCVMDGSAVYSCERKVNSTTYLYHLNDSGKAYIFYVEGSGQNRTETLYDICEWKQDGDKIKVFYEGSLVMRFRLLENNQLECELSMWD